MFRSRVIYLWLQMCGLATLMLMVGFASYTLFTQGFRTMLGNLLLLALPGAFAAMFWATVLGFPFMALMQRLLVAAGTHAGRPADFAAFRRWLGLYSLIPAALPFILLLLPRIRSHGWPAVGLMLSWALVTATVWLFNARRLHQEWNAGQSY